MLRTVECHIDGFERSLATGGDLHGRLVERRDLYEALACDLTAGGDAVLPFHRGGREIVGRAIVVRVIIEQRCVHGEE